MAKAQGIIGNFKGKVGNMVGYQLTVSNNKQTQGIRIYQPNVKNPKTSAQAEQRAKLAPINATYRALKMIIDRGNEGLPYGNKSRLAWLKSALASFNGPWFEKGATILAPALVPLTKGSLPTLQNLQNTDTNISLPVTGLVSATDTTIGAISTKILADYSFVKEGDQITFVSVSGDGHSMFVDVDSLVINSTSTEAVPSGLDVNDDQLIHAYQGGTCYAGAIILSREGANGEHLRSTNALFKLTDYPSIYMDDAAKTAAIKSYMATGTANTDWPQESIQ